MYTLWYLKSFILLKFHSENSKLMGKHKNNVIISTFIYGMICKPLAFSILREITWIILIL